MLESRVLRKSGNGAVLTVPTEVMEALGVVLEKKSAMLLKMMLLN